MMVLSTNSALGSHECTLKHTSTHYAPVHASQPQASFSRARCRPKCSLGGSLPTCKRPRIRSWSALGNKPGLGAPSRWGICRRQCTKESHAIKLVSERGRSRVSAAASSEKQGDLTATVTTIPIQASPAPTSNKAGWFILAGFLLAGAVVFFLVQRWKQSQNRLIKKGEAPIEGPWLWNSGVGSHRQPSAADIERARKKRADERGGRQLRPVFVAEGQLPPEGTDPEAVIEIPRNHPWATADLDDVPIDVLQRRLDQRRGPPDQAHETWRKIQQESARLEENFEEAGATETDLEWAESRRRRKAQLQDVASSRTESQGDRQ